MNVYKPLMIYNITHSITLMTDSCTNFRRALEDNLVSFPLVSFRAGIVGLNGKRPPGGIGETGTSAIVPAIANAIFAATGKRLRKMPIDASVLKQPA